MNKVNFVVSSNGKSHIQNPIAANSITLCRRCTNFNKSNKIKYRLNYCKICNNLYDDFKKYRFIIRDMWTRC